jgi:hypothetical protein
MCARFRALLSYSAVIVLVGCSSSGSGSAASDAGQDAVTTSDARADNDGRRGGGNDASQSDVQVAVSVDAATRQDGSRGSDGRADAAESPEDGGDATMMVDAGSGRGSGSGSISGSGSGV